MINVTAIRQYRPKDYTDILSKHASPYNSSCYLRQPVGDVIYRFSLYIYNSGYLSDICSIGEDEVNSVR